MDNFDVILYFTNRSTFIIMPIQKRSRSFFKLFTGKGLKKSPQFWYGGEHYSLEGWGLLLWPRPWEKESSAVGWSERAPRSERTKSTSKVQDKTQLRVPLALPPLTEVVFFITPPLKITTNNQWYIKWQFLPLEFPRLWHTCRSFSEVVSEVVQFWGWGWRPESRPLGDNFQWKRLCLKIVREFGLRWGRRDW